MQNIQYTFWQTIDVKWNVPDKGQFEPFKKLKTNFKCVNIKFWNQEYAGYFFK